MTSDYLLIPSAECHLADPRRVLRRRSPSSVFSPPNDALTGNVDLDQTGVIDAQGIAWLLWPFGRANEV